MNLRKLIAGVVALTVVLFLVGASCASASVEKGQSSQVTWLRKSINHNRSVTWRYQDNRIAKHTRTNYAERTTAAIPYLRWLRANWKARALAEKKIAKKYTNPYRAIRHVFGSEAANAISVSYCETGGNLWWTTAGYGKHDYWGIFQMGSGERSRYGFSWTVLGQVVAAHRMFLVRGWSPWQCMPGGGLRW